MATRNRTEIQAFIQALTAIHGEADYKEVLSDYLAGNLVFRKKVTGTASGSGSITVDFTDVDYIEVTASADIEISFTGISVGEEKILKVSKTAGISVSFPDDNDQTPNSAAVATLTDIYYHVYRVDTSGDIVINPMSKCILQATETVAGIAEIATATELFAGSNDEKVISAKKLGNYQGVVVFSAYVDASGTIYNRPSTINSIVDSITTDGDDFVITLNEAIAESTFNSNYNIRAMCMVSGSGTPSIEWSSEDTVNDETELILRFRDSSGNTNLRPHQLEIIKFT